SFCSFSLKSISMMGGSGSFFFGDSGATVVGLQSTAGRAWTIVVNLVYTWLGGRPDPYNLSSSSLGAFPLPSTTLLWAVSTFSSSSFDWALALPTASSSKSNEIRVVSRMAKWNLDG
ncbi:hypothetical protein PENTCL1PPCAC_27974, partial [Pristionchus entomophagus]